jgi:16S rRNA (guanine1207-N2)-methyltransferase
MELDIYYKKSIRYRYCRKELQFRVSQDLFSSFQIDTGTQFLLRTITPDCSSNFRKILDLGCGYGPIGLTLKALNPECVVHMVDRDALAVEYSRQNAQINGFSDVYIYGSLDYDDVTARDFDLIISNIPAKAGEPVIKHMVQDAIHYLAPDGNVAVVVVTPLSPIVSDTLRNNPNIEIMEEKIRSGHTVFRYRFKKQSEGTPPDIEKDAYHRSEASFGKADLGYKLETAYGLPEFERLSYHTELLLDGIKKIDGKNIEHVKVFNPGVGHIPVVMWKLMRPHKITLVDRDLLSLKYARKNLVLNGCPEPGIIIKHQVGVESQKQDKYAVAGGILREEEGTEATWQTLIQLAAGLIPHGFLLIAGSSTSVTRIVARLPALPALKVRERTKYRGFSLLVLETSMK